VPRRIVRVAASDETTTQHVFLSGPVTTSVKTTHGGADSPQVKVQLEIWELLLGKGAEINAKTSGGKTPLHYAAANKNLPLETLDWLIDHGADPSAKDSDGRTPLDYLSKEDREKIEQKYNPSN
jgi:ankyrin repeat protein